MHLAQLNIAKAKVSLEEPLMKDFVDNLDPVNTTAEKSEGFIWRLQDESGDATSIHLFDDPLIITNMSVWADTESLKKFMFMTHHLEFLQRKEEWFDKLSSANQVLWWVPKGHIPSLEEGKSRLLHLEQHGESSYAFTFRSKFTPHDLEQAIS